MKRRGKQLALAGGVVAVTVLLVVLNPFKPDNASLRLRPGDTKVTELGRQIYVNRCAACHGAKLEGQPAWRERDAQGRLPAPPHDASGHTWHHTDDLLFRITKFGVAKAANMPTYESVMPAYEGVLRDDEIVAVLSWIKSQWPAGIQSKHDEMNRSVNSQR